MRPKTLFVLTGTAAICLVILLARFTSPDCSMEVNRGILKGFFLKKTMIPQAMELLENGGFKHQPKLGDIVGSREFTIIHYLDVTGKNLAQELQDIRNYLTKNFHPDTRFIFIAGGRPKTELQWILKTTGFAYPLYYEKDYQAYFTLNRFPGNNRAFHTILLNWQGRIIAVGTPFNNKKVNDLYQKTMSCWYNDAFNLIYLAPPEFLDEQY